MGAANTVRKLRPDARLTIEQAAQIRVRYAAGGVSQETLADEYGVTQRVISLIVRRKTYKQVA